MAGSGYKVFTAGDVLTAADVQGHLQDQAVMRFADSTARATSIGTANFTEGMVSYLDNTNQVEYYNGSTWGSIAPVSNSGLTLLNTTSFSGVSSVSLPNDTFSSSYVNYQILIRCTRNTSADQLTARLRASGSDNSTSNYYFGGINVDSSGAGQTFIKGDPGTSMRIGGYGTQQSLIVMTLCSPFATDETAYTAQSGLGFGTNEGNMNSIGGYFNGTTSFDSMTVLSTEVNGMSGTVSCYGWSE